MKDYVVLRKYHKSYKAAGTDIISLKRISDGAVFSVGDWIKEERKTWLINIKQIYRIHGILEVSGNIWLEHERGATRLKDAIVMPQPFQ